MFEDQRDRFTKVSEALFARFALAVCAGDFGAIGDAPWAVLLDYCGELVAHMLIVALNPSARS